jgi:hypothetical protein
MATVATILTGDQTGVVRRSKFFVGMAWLLLLTVFAGFAPTLFLRLLFDPRPIPLYLHVHGALLTGWFVWLVVQTSLVHGGRTDLHRKIGPFGAAYAIIVIFAGLMATRGFLPNLRAEGIDFDASLPFAVIDLYGSQFAGPAIEFFSTVVWLNIASVATFGSLVLAAIVWRKRLESHKRLMLLASFSIIGPATGRVSQWPIFGGVEDLRVVFVGLGFAIVGLGVYDILKAKRLHPATYLGGALTLLMVIAGGAIATSDFGLSFTRWFG